MIYDSITVSVPLKKRIRKSGGPLYVYEVLARKGKHSDKDVVAFVGVLVDDNHMHPNEKYFELHPEYRNYQPLSESKDFDSQIHIGSSLLLRKVASREGLTQALTESFPGYSEFIMTLLEYYILRRDSAAQLYKYYIYDHYTELNYIPSESKISNLYNEYFTHERISTFLEKWMNYRCSLLPANSVIDIDFDSTNYNVSSSHVLSAEYGKAKVNEGLPQVNVAYFLDRKSGIPIYFDVYYGSIIDMTHCKTAIEKIKAIKKDINGSFVMDRGYFSKDNLAYMTKNNYSFMCMGKSNSVFKKLVKQNPKHQITKSKNRIYNTIFGIKTKCKPFKKCDYEYYVYLYYNEGDVATISAAKHNEVSYVANHLVGKKDSKQAIRNTYSKMIDIKTDSNDIIVSSEIKFDYLDEFNAESGYFWIVSNEDLSVSDALISYRHRDMVEKQFMYSKSGSDLNKTYSQDDAAFEAKSFMGFLSSILRAGITVGIRPYVLQYPTETSQTVLCEMDKITAECIKDNYVLRYALTSRQKQIMSLFDMNQNNAFEMIKNLDIRNNCLPNS